MTIPTKRWVHAGSSTMMNILLSPGDIDNVWKKFGLPQLWWKQGWGRSVVFLNISGCLFPGPCCQVWDTWLCVYRMLSISISPSILTVSWETMAVSLHFPMRGRFYECQLLASGYRGAGEGLWTWTQAAELQCPGNSEYRRETCLSAVMATW